MYYLIKVSEKKVESSIPPDIEAQLDDIRAGNITLPWGNVTGKPTTYPPSDHSHDEQGGTVTSDVKAGSVAVTEGQHTISYPTPYEAGTIVVVAIWCVYSDGRPVDHTQIGNPSETGFTINVPVACTVNYIAKPIN